MINFQPQITSLCAIRFAEEFTGHFCNHRKALLVITLTEFSHLTCVTFDTTERIQEIHVTALHILIECVERTLFPGP